ncbi:hypothetical protein PTI98_008253 [Pleurotus ostreatus]|nr:hypothetical protein PTI98_008253 [Pleurotus ostreatus]
MAVGLVLGSQLHKYGGSEQGEGICATIWTPTMDPIEHGERIDVVWAAVVLTNTWTAALVAPSDIPFNSPGFTIDTPWPSDTYGDIAFAAYSSVRRDDPEVPARAGRCRRQVKQNKAFLAKAAVLLERASYLHSQYRPDAPENEAAGLKNGIPYLGQRYWGDILHPDFRD